MSLSPAELLLDKVDWIAYPQRDDDPDGLPHATHFGSITFCEGCTLRCYQLSNGQRVLDADDVRDLFGGTYSGEFPLKDQHG